MIDEDSARYFCAVYESEIKKAVAGAKKAAKSDSVEKTGIQTAMALGPEPEKLNENWFTDLLNAPPAWVEEPTGFNLCAPEEVFKDDVKGGLEGYRKGQKMALAASGAAIAAAIPPLRRAALNLGKTVVKTAGKHPIASGAAAVALSSPSTTAKVAKNAIGDIRSLGKAVDSARPYLDKICAFFKPLADFFKEHPVYASALGAIGYGLLQTYPVWSPYIRRLAYEATSGKSLAVVEFEANDRKWRFEYSQRKNKWILLGGGKIADPADSSSFMKTRFAKKFIDRCADNFECLFRNRDVVLA